MATFQNAEELRGVIEALIAKIGENGAIVSRLVDACLVLRYRLTEPSLAFTVDMRSKPLGLAFGEEGPPADVEMLLSADSFHRFWLGELSATRAIATRKIVAKGNIAKALKLLPAIEPAFAIYPEVLRSLGLAATIDAPALTKRPAPRRRGGGGWRDLLAGLGRPRAKSALTREEAASLARAPLPVLATDSHPLQAAPPPAPAAPPASSPGGFARALYARMTLIRRFEERLAEGFAAGEIPTAAIHLSTGQEACAAGACMALRPDDWIATTHRGHGHVLAKGGSARALMAEILGKGAGLCGGKGGSMHATDATVGILGANGIVGASGLIATGAALAAKLRGEDRVAVAFLGDGATNQGMFHEAMNLASVWRLPVLFFVENNLYGEFTPLAQHVRVERLSDRAAAYGMTGVTIDGNDALVVHRAVSGAADRARAGAGPTLIEGLTYRWRGHMEGEPTGYRTEAEIEGWKLRCPLKRLRGSLLADGLSESEILAMETSSDREIAEAWSYARECPDPPLDVLEADVHSPDTPDLFTQSPHQTAKPSRRISCSQAIAEALQEEMARDERVFLMGEDVAAGGYFAVTAGLVESFGRERVRDTPISEYAIVGAAVGAAMAGMRPVVEILFSDFLTTCMDPIVNQAAKLRYMSGGQYRIPLVLRTPGGGGLGMAAQHSQSLEALLIGIPGLVILAPGTAADAKGLLKSAIRSDNPVLFFENKLLYLASGDVPEGEILTPIGQAAIRREGRDATIVAFGSMVGAAIEAARTLETEDGIDVEVVDLRTLRPLDTASVVRSVVKTGRLVTAEEGVVTGGVGAEIVARVAGLVPGALKGPALRVGSREVPIPYNKTLEMAVLPDAGRIREAVKKCMGE